LFQVREVGNQATWSLSSCKEGLENHVLHPLWFDSGSLDL
jgi:hypothetical protein